MGTRVASSRLIGRRAELEALEAALADAADGRPSVAFVAGDSGVGKTRMLAELMERAREGGALVLAGETVDFGGGAELPYLPLVAALRPLVRSGALTGPLGDAVAPLLPGAGAPADGGGDQARVFEGLLAVLDALGREQPVLLVIEDLHWADRSTRAALAFLARSLTDERVLVVGSYRSDELRRRDPLRALLAELERAPSARRVALEPLTREELAEQLADILGRAPEPELLERLWDRSGGNPLFGEELLAAGLDGRGAAPDTLRDALMLRVERMPDPARDLLALVAVGQTLDEELLLQTSDLEPRALREALRESVDHHILAVHGEGSYRFRHALLREVVEDDLLPGQRRELHGALARALEQRPDDGAQLAAAVAYHFDAAGERPEALAAAVRAATAAGRMHGYGEVLALLERALELWDRVPDPEALAGVDRVTVLTRAADAASAVGDPERQLALLEQAFAALGPEPDAQRAAVILEATSRAQRHANRARESLDTLERGLALVERDPASRAQVLAGLARVRMLAAHYSDAIAAARQALELAEAESLPAIEGHARNTLGCALATTGETAAGTEQLREAIRLAHAHDSLYDLAEAHSNYAHVLHQLGRTEEARAVAHEGRRAVAGRRPVAVMWLDHTLADLALDTGDWDEADAGLPDPQRWTGSQARVGILLCRARLALGRGEHDAAAALLAELEPMTAASTDPLVLGSVGVASGELERRRGDLIAASATVDRWLERRAFCREDVIAVSRLASAGVTVAADAAERARDLGDTGGRAEALARVDDLLARVAGAAHPNRPVESAALVGAQAEAGRAAGRPDPEAYARAAAAWESLGRPEPAAVMRWREAEALAAADRDAATEAARAAHALAVRLGAGWLRGEIEGLATRARLDLEVERAAAAEPTEEEDSFGLTTRERQVLALVASGATNREIGEALFMAQKTASVHVSRILAKLNVRSRTEAAAVAYRHGLVGSGE
jgi:DNA-binding CsgD family transcriptional regulator/tetratricopeptide (TPR) repeat protein